MKAYVVAIKDLGIDEFMNPFTVGHLGLAVRHFGDECQKGDSALSQHRKEFALYHLATFDTESGQFHNQPHPELIARGSDYVLDVKV